MVNGKKKSGVQSDSSGTVAEDSSGSRRSTRFQNNSSPSLRKSHRLEGRSPPATPPTKKKTENPSPLRRSGKDNKSQSPAPKGMADKGSPSSKGSKNKGEKLDQTLNEIAKEVKGESTQNSSSEVGSKRTKRLDARRYREMFKPLKKIKTSESETDKKRGLENSDASGDSDLEKAEVRQPTHGDGEERKGDGAKTIFDDADGSNSVVNDSTCADKPYELEDGDNNLPSPSPRKEAVENSDRTEEMLTGSVMEKLSNGEILSALDKLSHNSNGSGCSQKGVTCGASTIENEGTGMDSRSVLSSCITDSLSGECAKCFRKRSLGRDCPAQELCCCLSTTVNDMVDSQDRGQHGSYTAEFADEYGQNVEQSNSSHDVCGRICGTCQLAGKLLHCVGKGCKRSYHPSCSLNPEKNIFLPSWYCFECTKKRFAFGVHSVSQGIESVLDVRDVEQSTEGRLKQKQCFVKYKGLAHIHNRWLPEIQLLHEVPEFQTMVEKLKEDTQWNPVWAVPHRLLLRRSIVIDDTDQGVSLDSKRWHEWLVKWCGLDYDQVSWESENSSCFKSPEAQQMIKEYELRHNKVRTTSLPVNTEIQEKRKGLHVKLGRHLVGGADNYYQNFVNKLREWHHKGHNAILLDEQDRFGKSIHLVSSLVTSVSRPFLFIVPHASLPSWQTEFLRLASSINVVVYEGNADARNIIRSVEFFEDGQVMLQVLLSTAEVIDEDTEDLKGIEWEAVIIDDCQQSSILAHSGAIMNLATGWRLLLMNAQFEDNVSDYINMLSLLEPGGRYFNEEINVLKDKLSSFIFCARFIEYWVPVEMSNLQLEQYCYSILSKLSVLRSISKSDPVDSLREILISLRKCCDHPYIVDMQLQQSLADGLSYDAVMDLGIRASGKLHLLDNLLSEFKNQELKVLILFQPAGGSGRDSTGNILDDFLRFRFGSDSYEHVESGLQPSKKQTACNQFNSVKERSFLLMETRACSPSIKLTLVDAVIVFDSDWNPLNDLRALQKITIDSKFEHIKVFRLYCPGTVEEKVLILAKNDVILDSTLQSTSRSTSHMLLMWGSSYLFSRLHKFHQKIVSDCKDNLVFESSLSMDVTQEIVSLFQNRKLSISSKNISVAQQSGGCYLKSIPLIGEQRIPPDDGAPPHAFWTNLLEGLKPQWKYLSGSSQRNRKRVQYNEELSSRIQSDEAIKRRKKIDGPKIDPSPSQSEPRLETSIINSQSKANTNPNPHEGIGHLSVETNGAVTPELDVLKNLHNEQRGLFELLKPTILQLCEALLLKDDGKRIIEQFLEYLVKHYRVTKEPETRLQAFLLSVCWTAVEGLDNKIDHKKSVTIVREKLGFSCTESEAEDLYSKLKPIYSCSDIMNHRSSVDLSPAKAEKGLEKCRKKVERGCDKQLEKLKVKHDEELTKSKKSWEDERMKLEDWCKAESALIRVTHANSSIGIEKLRSLDNDYAKRRKDLERKISECLKELEARQQIEREEEQKRIAGYMERVKSLGHSSYANNRANSQLADPIGPGKESNETVCNNGNLLEKQNSEREASRISWAANDSIASENLETTEKQRASCENGDSINASDNLVLNRAGIIMSPPEQPCGSTGHGEKDTNLVNAVVEDCSTSLSSNQSNEDHRMGTSTKQLVTDTIQAHGAESYIGVEEGVLNETGINNSSTLDESSPLNNSNHAASILPRTGEMNNSTGVSYIIRLENQLNENHASIGGSAIPMHRYHTSPSSSGVAILQRPPQLNADQSVNTNTVPIGVVSSHASLPSQLQAPFTSISRVTTSLPDPLQLELDRLHNEMTKVKSHHEGTKSQLKTECEKEIEELVSQVRKKYERKRDEAEASFSLKRNELEMCQHKVMMNKILAEAFRSKCTDYKAAPKMQQLGIPSSSVENSRSHHTRPFPATGPLSTAPVAGPLSTAPPVQGLSSTASLVTQSRMARVNPGVAPMAGQQQQVRREAHAPPMPIPAFRSSTAISSGVPMVPLRNNPMSTSALHLPLQAPQLPPPAQSNHPQDLSHQEGSLGRGTPLDHLSNTELLRNITRQNDAILQYSRNVPPFRNNVPSSESWDMSKFEGATDPQQPSSSLPAGDVVCLSDDE